MCWKLAIQYKPPDIPIRSPRALRPRLVLGDPKLLKDLSSFEVKFLSLLFRKQGLPSLVGVCELWCQLWQNHPKLLGPGALIFVAKQLWPNLALTGSSSSEASIKATLFQDQQTTLTRRWAQRLQHRSSHTSQSLQRKGNLLQTIFRVAKYYRSPNYTNYSSLIISAKRVNDY